MYRMNHVQSEDVYRVKSSTESSKLNSQVERAALLLHIREIRGSDIGPKTGYPD
jgi:hypothetical protein